jgi:hypothetical protein
MTPGVPVLKAREVVRILERLDFVEVCLSGLQLIRSGISAISS